MPETVIELYPKETAVIIRRVLRATFPEITFRVVTGRGSMVSAVDVVWTEGPTVAEVEAVLARFEAGRFNGMTDGYDYASEAKRTFTFDGVTYVACTQYVHAYRHRAAVECVQ